MAELVTCSQDSVVFWDYKSFSSKRSAQPFNGSGYHISSACWSPSNSKLMVAPKWGDCIAWCEPATDASSWNTVWHRDGGHFTCGFLMSNSRFILSGGSDGLLMLWDIKSKSSTKIIEGHISPVTGVVGSSNDQLVLSGGQDGTLLLHSLSSSHTLKHTVTLSRTDATSQGAITRLRFSVMDRAMAASASETGCVCLWSVESQRMLHEFLSSQSATDLYFAQSNNKLLVSVGKDSKIHFLDIQQRKEVMLVTTPSPLMSVAILRDGYTVAAGGVDGKLYVYELRAMKSPKHVIEAHQGAITCIAEQNSVKSSRGSLKRGSSKKSAKGSTRQSVLTPSDSPAPGRTPSTAQDGHLTQLDSASNASAVISPLAPVPTGVSATGIQQQTPFLAPRASSGVQWAQFTTPAQPASDKDSTGIFSPVDSALSTPHPSSTQGGSSGSKATAAISPTQRLPSGGPARSYPLMSTFVSSTPAVQPPLGMSGIFSPLDAATSVSLAMAVPGWPALQYAPSATPSAATPALYGVNVVQPPPNLIAGQSDGGVPSTAALPPPSSTSPHTSRAPTSTAGASTAAATSASQTSLLSQSSAESSSSSQQRLQQLTHASHPVTDPPPPSAVEGVETVRTAVSSLAATYAQSHPQAHGSAQLPSSTAPLPEAGIHLQYLEKVIRDSSEELRYATHRDIRALGLDMFRQFMMLQQQFGRAVSVLDEKIERLSEENKHLQEQLHQYMPKY